MKIYFPFCVSISVWFILSFKFSLFVFDFNVGVVLLANAIKTRKKQPNCNVKFISFKIDEEKTILNL